MRGRVETALLIDPLPSRAYRLLGQIPDNEGLDEKAGEHTDAGGHPPLAQRSFRCQLDDVEELRTKELPITAYYADVLLRSEVMNIAYMTAIVGAHDGGQ